MQVNIRAVPQEGDVLPFEGSLDLSRVSRWGQQPFPAPIQIRGQVRNRHGMVSVEYQADYTLHAQCARCLRDVDRPQAHRFSHIAVESWEEEYPEDWVEAPEGVLALDELAEADLVLNLEAAPLCREDCLGLCPVCGADRNENPCDCARKKPTDPRFAALLEFLE